MSMRMVTKLNLAYNPRHPSIPEESFVKLEWTDDFYQGGAAEKILQDAPKRRGHYVTTHCFIGPNHAGCKKTQRCSVTGVLDLDKQNTVEASIFELVFVAMPSNSSKACETSEFWSTG